MRIARKLVFACLASIAGCRPAAPDIEGDASHETDLTFAAGARVNAALLWEVGTNSEPADSFQFGSIRGIDRSEDGRIYVLDGLNSEVLVFSPNGDLHTRFGKAGDGPGELRDPRALAVANDTVVVLDNRLALFSADGSTIGTTTSRYNFQKAFDLEYSTAGLILVQRIPGDRAAPTTMDTFRLMTFDASSPDTVRPMLDVTTRTVAAGAELSLAYPRSFSGPPFVTSRDGRIFVRSPDSFKITVHDADGALQNVISHPVSQTLSNNVDDADYKASLKLYSGLSSRGERQLDKAAPRGEFRPVIGTMLVSPSGALLLERIDLTPRPYARFDTAAISRWVITTPDGSPIANIELPIRFRPLVFQECLIIGSRRLADDSETVAVYRIDAGACPN